MAASTSELQVHKHSGKGEGETVGIALLGFGTVGAEVFRLLGENENNLKKDTKITNKKKKKYN